MLFFEDFLARHNISFSYLKELVTKIGNSNSLVYGDCIIDRFTELNLIGTSREDGLPVYEVAKMRTDWGVVFYLPKSSITLVQIQH